MPRLPHGMLIHLEHLRNVLHTGEGITPPTPQEFGFLLPELQDDDRNFLPVSRQTRDTLVVLGEAMTDQGADDPVGDSDISAAYPYFGQFVDHDITLEAQSGRQPGSLTDLVSPDLEPLPLSSARERTANARTARLELDSVYGLSAPRNAARMEIGNVTEFNTSYKPFLRPPGKGDDNDLPREGRSDDFMHDRAALIGDPRNDDNTITAQLHLAFLLAHNALIDEGETFKGARRTAQLDNEEPRMHLPRRS